MPRIPQKKGFTLAELLLAAAILGFVLAGLLTLFINCIFLNTNNRNFTRAYSNLQAEMEEIKNAGFDGIDAYNGATFGLTGLSGNTQGRVTVTNETGDANLKRVRIVGCFMSQNRQIGDSLANCQNSPIELVTLFTQ